jgi:hypothetical protein
MTFRFLSAKRRLPLFAVSRKVSPLRISLCENAPVEKTVGGHIAGDAPVEKTVGSLRRKIFYEEVFDD